MNKVIRTKRYLDRSPKACHRDDEPVLGYVTAEMKGIACAVRPVLVSSVQGAL